MRFLVEKTESELQKEKARVEKWKKALTERKPCGIITKLSARDTNWRRGTLKTVHKRKKTRQERKRSRFRPGSLSISDKRSRFQDGQQAKKRSEKAERIDQIWEFDPGSGQTLAACFKHASRTEVKCSTKHFYMRCLVEYLPLVADGWVTRE